MKIIQVALMGEAKPFIRYFQLKKDHKHRIYQVFKNENLDLYLIVSGMGPYNALAAASYMLGQYEEALNDNMIYLNVGICGAMTEKFLLGELFYVNKVIDASTDREYFPDIWVRHGIEEAALKTFPKPQRKSSHFESDLLVDMEASALMHVLYKFIETDRIIILKVVSDYLEGSFNKDFIEDKLWQHAAKIEEILGKLEGLLKRDRMDESWDKLSFYVERFRLSESQTVKLNQWRQYLMVSGRDMDELLSEYLDFSIIHKRDSARLMKSIEEKVFKRYPNE